MRLSHRLPNLLNYILKRDNPKAGLLNDRLKFEAGLNAKVLAIAESETPSGTAHKYAEGEKAHSVGCCAEAWAAPVFRIEI